MIGGVTDAEIAVAGAFVGQIDVKIVSKDLGGRHKGLLAPRRAYISD